ncbi:MAG: hypothetical protein JWO05_1003 [Gemmatimonadetes bacterium]|nr:hypothetical protein [Gemmatimonadota bacterium]
MSLTSTVQGCVLASTLLAATSCGLLPSGDCALSAVSSIIARTVDQSTGAAITSRLTLVTKINNVIVDSVSVEAPSNGTIASHRIDSGTGYVVFISAAGYTTETRGGVEVTGTRCGGATTYFVVPMRRSAVASRVP